MQALKFNHQVYKIKRQTWNAKWTDNNKTFGRVDKQREQKVSVLFNWLFRICVINIYILFYYISLLGEWKGFQMSVLILKGILKKIK